MEAPENRQCFCYAIMSSLCFLCQVKVHLLHLTASPHGELTKTVKDHSPKEKPRLSQKGKERSRTPTSPERTSPDCNKCDYYMNYINKLTSGLCEDKIVRMVCSNPCLISTDAANHDTIEPLPSSKSTTNRDEPVNFANWSPKKSATLKPSIGFVGGPNHRKASVSSRWSAKGRAKEQSARPINNKIPPPSTMKAKFDNNSDKRPATPIELMTTDKILKRSFESIGKNRQSSSRAPSPAKKNSSNVKPGVANHIKIVTTPANGESAAKCSNKQMSTEQKSPGLTSSPMPPKNWQRNETTQLQPVGQEVPNRKSKTPTSILVSAKAKDVSKAKTASPNGNLDGSQAKKQAKPPEQTADSPIKCNDEVCEFHPGVHHKVDHGVTGREIKEDYGNQDMKTNRVENNAGKGGFFEAALEMEFYRPPQLGTNNTSKKQTKRLVKEWEDEPSILDLGGSILRQFCEKSKKDGSNSRELTPNDDPSKCEILPTMPTQSVESFPIVRKNRGSKSKKQGAYQKAETPQSKSKHKELPKQSKRSTRGGLADEMKNESYKRITEEMDLADRPMPHDKSSRGEVGCGNDQRSAELTNLDKAKERFNGTGHTSSRRRASRNSPRSYTANDGNSQFGYINQKDAAPGRNFTAERIQRKDVEGYEKSKYSKVERDVCEAAVDSNTVHDRDISEKRWTKDSSSKHEINAKIDTEYAVCEFIVEDYQTEIDGTNQKNGKGRPEVVEKGDDAEVEHNHTKNSPEEFDDACEEEPEKMYGHDREYVGARQDGEKAIRTSNQMKSKYDEDGIGNVRKSMSDSNSSYSDDKTKKSKSPNRHRGSGSGIYGEDSTRVYPQFSEYMNPDSEGYRSKSTGNVADDRRADAARPDPDPFRPSPDVTTKSCSHRDRNCGACPDDDKRMNYRTDSDGQCTSMVIGLPQDSSPHIRINFNKQTKKEINFYRVDKSEQKYDYRDTGTQCDGTVGETSPNPSRPATAKTSKNKVPPKTAAKPTQSGQMYYNRPLMRRSFL